MSGLLARRAKKAAAGGFDPIGAFTWEHSYWAEDPGWTAPADGAEVTTWDDSSGTDDLTKNGAASSGLGPPYRASGTLLGKPCVEFAPGLTVDSLAVTFSSSMARPWSVVVACGLPTTTYDHRMLTGGTGATNALAIRLRSGTNTRFYGVTEVSMTTSIRNSNGHVLIVVSDASAPKIRIDGSSASTASLGTDAIAACGLGNTTASASATDAEIGFVGYYSGDITAATGFSAFESDLLTHYGV